MFKKILVPIDVDYPKTAATVYQKAVALGKPSGAEIRLVSVMPGFGMPIVASHIPDEVHKETVQRFEDALKAFIKANCDESVSYTVATGKNWEEIIDLIVVYHNRRDTINEAFSSSCSERVADKANCSVLRLRNIMS
jgi:nucleotide-binding universal stress UspA family protein